jgi:membrane dipeptidase
VSTKNYDGYEAYDYLDAAEYKRFPLAPQVERVAPYDLELSDAQEQRAQHLLDDALIISLHDHPCVVPRDVEQIFDYRRQGRDHMGYKGLSTSGLDAVFDNFTNGTAMITSKSGWKWEDIIHDIGLRFSDLAHQEFVVKAVRLSDIYEAHAHGRVALIASLEAATPIENELDRLDILYGLGIRSMGIAYSEANALGGGLREDVDGGLTRFGEQAVERMNRLGIAIDISHSGDRTSMDVIRTSSQPVMITHAGARALWDSRRLKPDEVIIACADSGGVIGIEAAPHTTVTTRHPRHSIESVMEHFEYCAELVGIEHVGFGPDTLFGDHVGLHKAFARELSVSAALGKDDLEEVDYVAGMESPAEAMPNVLRWLVKHDYSDHEIRLVMGLNGLRVLEEVWAK